MEEVFARSFRDVIILMSELLPTLERPINAYSFRCGAGHSDSFADDFKNWASLICMLFFSKVQSNEHKRLGIRQIIEEIGIIHIYTPLSPTLLRQAFRALSRPTREKLFTSCRFVGNGGIKILLL